MNKAEAQALVGRRVSVWTGASGTYVGVLEQVLPTRPWRGRVRIDGITAPAVCYEAGRPYRRGFRVGEEIVAGGTNIEPTEALGATDYPALLDEQADRFAADHAAYRAGAHGDPADPCVAKLYAWRERAAAQVRAAAARARYEGLSPEEGVEVTEEGAHVRLRTPFEDEAVSGVLRAMPGYRCRWDGDTRSWTVPADDVPELRARLGAVGGESARLLRERLPGTTAPAP